MNAYMVIDGEVRPGIPHGYAYGLGFPYRATYIGVQPIIWPDKAISRNERIVEVPGYDVILMITDVREGTIDRSVYAYASDGLGHCVVVLQLGECEEVRWKGGDGQWYCLTVKDGVPLVTVDPR